MPSFRHPVRRHRCLSGLAVVATLALATAGTSSASPANGRNGRSRAAAPAKGVSFTFTDSDPLSGLAGDPDRPAVWFWNVNNKADVVYRLEASGQLRSWAVLSGRRRVVPGLQAGLAVGRGGGVWLGVGRTLVRLDPSTGSIRTWTVPAGRVNPVQARGFPHGGPPRISGVTVSASGQVGIALFPMSSVTTLDPSTGRFAVVDLPSTSDAETAIAYDGGDTLGVGMADLDHGGRADHVYLITGAHRRDAAVTGSGAFALGAYRSGSFVVGLVHPQRLAVRQPAVVVHAPGSLTGTDSMNQPLELLSGDRLVGQTRSGALVLPAAAASDAAARAASHLYPAPTQRCDPDPPPPPPGSTQTGRHEVCRERTAFVATDHGDDIWIVTGTNDDTVLLLAHA